MSYALAEVELKCNPPLGIWSVVLRYSKTKGYYIENTDDIQKNELRKWLGIGFWKIKSDKNIKIVYF